MSWEFNKGKYIEVQFVVEFAFCSVLDIKEKNGREFSTILMLLECLLSHMEETKFISI